MKMHEIIRQGIAEILKKNRKLLKIPIRQKAKFEGWLKFELANWLEIKGYEHVEVESEKYFGRSKTDITFFHDEQYYKVELKTPNTNWKIPGVTNKGRPITDNIYSIIGDAEKLNSEFGIVAFVLFPVPINDNRWEVYLDRIKEKTELNISRESNCEIVKVAIDDKNKCSLVICSFKSKRFNNWF